MRTSILTAGLFLAGLLAGVWVVIASWVIGYPAGGGGSWTSMTWAGVWAGAVVVTASAVALVVTIAALPARPPEESRTTGGSS